MIIRAFTLLSLMALLSPAYSQTIGEIGDETKKVNEGAPVKIIEPEKEAPSVRYAAIDDEKFELGIFVGNLALEDFSSSFVSGFAFSYHISPQWLGQLAYGTSKAGKAVYEEQGEGNILEDDRKYSYYALSAGYRILPGRSFFGENAKFNSDLYLLGGINSTTFDDHRSTGYHFGTSYRIVFTDALVANLDFRTYSYKRKNDSSGVLLVDGKQTLNNELSVGLNWLF